MASATHHLDKATLPADDTTAESAMDPPAFVLTIQYHPDLDRIGERALLPELAAGKGVDLSRGQPLFSQPGRAVRAEPLDEEHLSRTPLRLLPVDGGIRLAIGKSGTRVDVGGQRVLDNITFTMAQIREGVVLELATRVVLLLHLSAAASRSLTAADLLGPDRDGIVGESDRLLQALWNMRAVADLHVPVLLCGETGSGKEVMARAIHRRSPRRDGPFVAVNAGAIPPSLVVSEMFGAEPGAFTGSKKRIGYFEQADGGTLFLDEIGEAPPELQTMLLRVLEERRIPPLGAQKSRKVDVRVLAATDADLHRAVRAGSFREPLLHRLNEFQIQIPPLRERRDDIGRFLLFFLRKAAESIGEKDRLRPPAGDEKPWFPARLAARLCEHDWPGNVRQLAHVVSSLVIASRTLPRVTDVSLPGLLLSPAPRTETTPADPPPAASPARKPADVTDAELEEALQASDWDVTKAARRLGIKPQSVYILMRRHPSLRPAGDLDPEEIERQARACDGDLDKMAEALRVSRKALARRMTALGMKPAK